MKLRPKAVHQRKFISIGNYVLAFFTSVFIFGCIVGLFPGLRGFWGLILFVPFSLVFTLAYCWAFSFTEELDKKLGESKEEQRQKLQAHLGLPFDKNDHLR